MKKGISKQPNAGKQRGCFWYRRFGERGLPCAGAVERWCGADGEDCSEL